MAFFTSVGVALGFAGTAAFTAGAVVTAGAALAVGGSVLSSIEAGKARRQQKKQFEEGEAFRRAGEAKASQVAELKNTRSKRAAIREAQIKRADNISRAEQTGSSESTAFQGTRGSLTTQGNVNLSFLDTTFSLSSQAQTLFGNASSIERRPIFQGTIGSTLSAIGGTVGSFATLAGKASAGARPTPKFSLGGSFVTDDF